MARRHRADAIVPDGAARLSWGHFSSIQVQNIQTIFATQGQPSDSRGVWRLEATSKSVLTSVPSKRQAVSRCLAVKEDVRMRFEDRTYETQLAKAEWLLEQAARWNDRDPEFADLLRTKARLIDRSQDQNTSLPVRR
jgi:hypothetical protein